MKPLDAHEVAVLIGDLIFNYCPDERIEKVTDVEDGPGFTVRFVDKSEYIITVVKTNNGGV